jgi:hypothetical protein
MSWGRLGAGLVTLGCTLSLACGSGNSKQDAGPEPEEVTVTVDRAITLTDEARIPQSDPAFDRAEVSADGLVFHFTSKPRVKLAEGNVVVGTGEAPYLRTITRVVSETDTRVEVETEHAELVNLIRDGAFTMQYHPFAQSWNAHVAPELSGVAFKTSFNVFSFTPGGGFKCTPTNGTAQPVNLEPYLEPDFAFKLSADIEPSLLPPFGELKTAEFSITGSVLAGADISVSTEVGLECVLDLIAYLRSSRTDNYLRLKASIATAIGPVPVQVTLFIDPVFQFEAALSGKIDVVANANGTLGATVGVQYADGAWTGIFEPTTQGSVTTNIGEDSVLAVALSGKVAAGISMGGLLYDTAGPTFGLEAFLEDKVEIKPQDCEIITTGTLGADAKIGVKVQVPVIAKEIATISESFPLARKQVAKLTDPLPMCLDAGVDAGPVDAGVDAGADAAVVDAAIADAAADAALADADTTDAGSGDILVAATRNGDIYQIDTTTGAQTLLLDTSNGAGVDIGVVSSILWVPSQNQLWLGMGGNSLCGGCLNVLNTTTGVPTLLSGTSGTVPGLALRGTGQIYTAVGDNKGLRSLDPATGADSSIASATGEGQGNGMTFAAGVFYLTGNSNLYTVDPDTGVSTLAGAFTYSGFPAPTTAEFAIPAMATRASDGTVFVIVHDGGTITGAGPTFIATLDPGTRVVTNIAQTSAKMDGLAFVPAGVF